MLAPKPGQFPLSQFDTLGKFFAHLGKKNWRLSLKSLEVCWGYSYKVLHLLRSETKDQRGPGTRALSYSPFPPCDHGQAAKLCHNSPWSPSSCFCGPGEEMFL